MGDVTVLAVTGLNREARIVAGPGVISLASGGDLSALQRRIEEALRPEIRGVISIGIAGALKASLQVGDAVIATEIWLANIPSATLGAAPLPRVAREAFTSPSPLPAVEQNRETAKGAFTQQGIDQDWADRLAAALPDARRGPMLGSSTMVVDAAAKAALYAQTGALCVDMESHVAAKVAAAHGLPFAALRFISDGADRALPKAAQAGMKPDGGMNIWGVLRALAADPRQLPDLIRTGREAETAFRALLRRRNGLGAALGLADV